MTLGFDLNAPPPVMNWPDHEGSSYHQEGTSYQPPSGGGGATGPQGVLVPAPTIILDDDDDADDVVITEPRAFTDATNNYGGVRGGPIMFIDVDPEESTRRLNLERFTIPSEGLTIVHCDNYISEREMQAQRVAPPLPPPPPPPRPKFDCPICMGPFVEEMSTKCGHIFCKACIKTALGIQKKCPTCRMKLTARSIRRIYLPSGN